MRDFASTIARLWQLAPPIAAVFYRDENERQELRELVEIVGTERVIDSVDANDVFARNEPIALLPQSERDAIELLNARRENLRERKQPAFIFLLKGGSGEEALREPANAALESWLRGTMADPFPIAEHDDESLRHRFIEDAGCEPEEWLARYRSEAPADTDRTMDLYLRARFLAREQ